MRATILASLLIASVFSGCCSKTQSFEFGCVDTCVPDTHIVHEKEYIKQEVPSIPQEPTPDKYKTLKISINGKVYWATDKINTAKMIGNWKSHQGYTEHLRNILYNLKDTNISKEK